jgi:hypothetical protein
MILVVQTNKEKDTVEVLFDKQGLELLRTVINKDWYEPINKENNLYDLDHEHLSSKDWGGDELTPEFTSQDSEKIHSVKIVYLGTEGETILS